MQRPWPLIGRAEELAVIRAAVRRPDGRHGIVLAGSAGVGKTRLALAALSAARRGGAVTHWFTATECTRQVPFGSLAPALGALDGDPFRVFHHAAEALVPTADTEVVIGVDDVQLVDDLSAALLAITAFGLVVAASPGPAAGGGAHWTLWPAAGCLVLAGSADAVSAVFRQTILQAATPDHLRGRLQGIFIVVVAGGPRLGDIVLGGVAEVGTEAVAAIGGGIACVLAVAALALLQPRFAKYDARQPAP